MLLIIAITSLCFAAILYYLAARRRAAIGLPAGRVIYSDTRLWGAVEKPFYNAELHLTGKPDYLVQKGGKIIPVEVKSSHVTDGAYDAHIIQLGVYCILVHRRYGKRPPYGILHYPNGTYAVDFTPHFEQTVINLIEAIHAQDRVSEVARSHESHRQCSHCGYRLICDQKLM